MTIILGVSQIDITPGEPVPLAGFASRKGNMEGLHSNIYLKIFIFESNNQMALLFIGDLIWWDRQSVKEWRNKIFERYSIPPEAICFHATHNHSGPQTSNDYTTFLGLYDEAYVASLENKIFIGIDRALKNKEEVSCKLVETACQLGVYRRRKENGQIVMQPDVEKVCHSNLSVITFETKSRDMKAVFVHYACHPTSTDLNILSSEYTGKCCSRISEQFETAVVGFLQGCCGDIRPAFIHNNKFYKSTLEEMEAFGATLGDKVLLLIDKAKSKSEQLSEGLTVAIKNVSLPFKENFQPLASVNRHSDVFMEWKETKKNYGEYINLEIQKIIIGNKIHIIAFNGEMVQEYERFIKDRYPNAIPIGYSNGMLGYVPTAEQIEEGGYEAEDSIYYFGLPAPFQVRIEEIIKRAIITIMEGDLVGNKTNPY